MKRIHVLLLFAFALLSVIPVTARATSADFSGSKTKWKVEFTSGKKMESTFNEKTFNDAINQMEPGDSVLFTVNLKNSYKDSTRWYMTNKVLKSLENASKTAKNGAYEYELRYINGSGTSRVLYSNDEVGGEGAPSKDVEGLNEAANNLKNYVYLDTLSKGSTGKVTLKVALDGETQGNSYQDTRARVQMNFAVELDRETTRTRTRTRKVYRVAKTGDYSDLRLYFILAGVSGLLLLGFGGYSVWLRRAEKAVVRREGDEDL